VQNQIYDPLTIISKSDLRKQSHKSRAAFVPLFQATPGQNAPAPPSENLHTQLHKDTWLKKIFSNTKEKPSKALLEGAPVEPPVDLHSFNFDSMMRFEETPGFRQALQSPLYKFCSNNQGRLAELYRVSSEKEKIKEVSPIASPLPFKERPGAYFMGVALEVRNRGCVAEPLFFYHLAAYS
jgi:hypothetical protein